jgi:hypothetical protein
LFFQLTGLVIGGNGALGKAIIEKYKEIGWKTISVDFSETEGVDASFYIQSFEQYEIEQIITRLKQLNFSIFFLSFHFGAGLSAIYVLSGFQAEGSVKDNVFQLAEQMWHLNVLPAISGLTIASHCLEPEGYAILARKF